MAAKNTWQVATFVFTYQTKHERLLNCVSSSHCTLLIFSLCISKKDIRQLLSKISFVMFTEGARNAVWKPPSRGVRFINKGVIRLFIIISLHNKTADSVCRLFAHFSVSNSVCQQNLHHKQIYFRFFSYQEEDICNKYDHCVFMSMTCINCGCIWKNETNCNSRNILFHFFTDLY